MFSSGTNVFFFMLINGFVFLCDFRAKPLQPPIICKANLYKMFKQLCTKYNHPELLKAATYSEAKNQATDFQNAKKLMFKKFRKSGFGRWVEKPVEEGMFS